MQYVGQTTQQKPVRNNLKKGNKSSEPSAIYTPALAPTNLLTFLYKLHLRKSDRVIHHQGHHLETAINTFTPSPSQNCKCTHIQAHNGKTLHGSQRWLMYTELVEYSTLLVGCRSCEQGEGEKNKHGTKAFTATIMNKR